jgi:hypothetical protein
MDKLGRSSPPPRDNTDGFASSTRGRLPSDEEPTVKRGGGGDCPGALVNEEDAPPMGTGLPKKDKLWRL